LDAGLEQKVDKASFESFASRTNEILDELIENVQDYMAKKGNLVLRSDFDTLAEDLHRMVDVAANAAVTNTRCLACGKRVDRVVGSQVNRPVSRGPPLSARGDARGVNFDLLRLDGLELGGERGHTGRGSSKRPATRGA
jgi:hypothetical protein